MTYPTASLVIVEQRGEVYVEAKFRVNGQQVKRRIGRAWLDRVDGRWQPRKGRIEDGYFDERRAHVRAAEIVAGYVAEDRIERERKAQGISFRELAREYLEWFEHVRRGKPSTLVDHRLRLGEPGKAHKRGDGQSNGYIMAALGDMPARKITTTDVERMLSTVKGAPRTINKYRGLVKAIFRYGMKAHGLPSNPAQDADRRPDPHQTPLVYYSPEDIEALARASEDPQHGELIRVAAYAGLRMGELLALRWRDVDFPGHALTISRAMSAGVESSTKSGKVRRVPLPDQAAAALDRLSRREDFAGPDELVFPNALGRPLDGSALRRRFKAARDAAGLRPLRFHDLRHTYGSQLAAHGVDLVAIQAAMGHSSITTTSRYLHAKPTTEQAAIFTRAFEADVPSEAPGALDERDRAVAGKARQM